MAAKSKGYKPEYTYEKLGEILKDSTQKAKTGKLDLEGKLYGIAAGYAQDFVDTSRAIKHPWSDLASHQFACPCRQE